MKQLFSAIVLTASIACATAQIGGPAVTLFSYGPTSGSWATTNGTAATNQFFSRPVVLETSKATQVGLGVYYVGRADFTQAVNINVWPSYDGVNKSTVHSGTTTNSLTILSVTGTGATPVYAHTNLSVSTLNFGALTGAPYLIFELSKLGANGGEPELTNGWVRAVLK